MVLLLVLLMLFLVAMIACGILWPPRTSKTYRTKTELVERAIPRINHPKELVHQIAGGPAQDLKTWSKTWKRCQETWKRYCKRTGATYLLWNDDDLDAFVKEHHQDKYDMYVSYDLDIKRWDVARPMLLATYGGIYADLDMELCDDGAWIAQLPIDRISIVQNEKGRSRSLQNSLMASMPDETLWEPLFEVLRQRCNNTHNIVQDVTGPGTLTALKHVNELPRDVFNAPGRERPRKCHTFHHSTHSWKQSHNLTDLLHL